MSELANALPEDFTVGVGTSSWQVEGASASRGRTIWDDFAEVPGAIVDGTTADPACEHVARMQQDVDLLAWLGVDAYRFSVAWARVQPGGSGPMSPAGTGPLRPAVRRAAGPGDHSRWSRCTTGTCPASSQAEGGWLNPRTGELFGQYADAMATRLGDRVGAWATLNEPWCSAFLGYAAGVHAPGRQAPAEALEVAYRLLVAHARGLEGLRAGGAQQCGIVLNMMPTFPDDAYRDDPVVARAARHIDGLQNDLWLDALAGRGLNADVVAGTAEITDWAFVGSAELAGIAAPLDWLGVNYYTVQRLAAVEATADRAVGQGAEAHPGCPPVRFAPREPLTTMGWEVNPDGLGRDPPAHRVRAAGGAVVGRRERHGPARRRGGRPCDDPRRVDYLQRHLDQVVAVRSEGVDIRGYLAWSLFDNIEWAEGWQQRFGVVHVDPQTQVRTPKASAHWLRDLQAARRGR